MHKFLNSVRKRYIVLAIWCVSVCVQILGNLFFPSCFFPNMNFCRGVSMIVKIFHAIPSASVIIQMFNLSLHVLRSLKIY